MPIPKPSETKQPILNYLSKAGKPVKKSDITELMGVRFNLSKKEMEETSLKGSKRFAMCIIASTKEMKAAGLIKSPRHGYLQITAKGRGGLAGSTTQAGSANGRRKPGRPPKAKSTNGRRKPGRPPKVQVKAKNGRRKHGRPKTQPATLPSVKQISATISKQDNDKLVQRTADIVISYAGNNTIKPKQIPEIIKSTYAALSGLGTSSVSSRKTTGKRKYTRRKKIAKKKA